MTAIQLDTTFGQGGWAGPTTTGVLSVFSAPTGLVRTRTGTLVVAGTGQLSDGEHFYLTAFEANGQPDARFGTGGAVVSELPHVIGWALAIQGPAKGPIPPPREQTQMLLVGGQMLDPDSGNYISPFSAMISRAVWTIDSASMGRLGWRSLP